MRGREMEMKNKKQKIKLKFLVLAVFMLIISGAVNAGWLTGYAYRKNHTINSASGAGTNYQVCIKVYSGSGTDGTETVYEATCGKVYLNNHASNWPNDIRFTGSDGTTLLYNWKETSDSSSAVFLGKSSRRPGRGKQSNLYLLWKEWGYFSK